MINTIAPIEPRNPGIVPPWLLPAVNKNPGTVPPWFSTPTKILPVENGETQFVHQSTDISPMTFVDVLRAR